jgi:hypothetical protein
MRILLLLLVIASALLPAEAFSQQVASSRGSKQEQDACRSDAVRLCRDAIGNGDMAVLSCFKRQRDRLNVSCQQVLRTYGQL